ncbi:extracellular solute-binding protein [Paenibacillus xanthanilyticus]|uniref:Extracellular solute-binding protein n=1 Tax=Paenibacillus xanthanilyticus TaxID=1783531 RepID=A0ABV8JVF0_9BACL
MESNSRLEALTAFLASRAHSEAKPIWMPAVWNQCGFQSILGERDGEILVHPYQFLSEHFRYLRATSKQYAPTKATDPHDSVIYSSLVRYTTAWDYDHDGMIESGTFLRLIVLLPLLKTFGVTILYMLPVNRYSLLNLKGDIGSPYAVQSLFDLDPNLHDPLLDGMDDFTLHDELAALVEACHLLDIKAVVDFIPRVTAKNSELMKENPEWVYWIKNEALEGFAPPPIPELGFFEECTPDKLETVYRSKDTQAFLDKFSLPPNQLDLALWEALKARSAQTGEELLTLVEQEMGITTAPAHSDWINDVQPIWTDITFLRLYKDVCPQSRPYLREGQAPYVLFDTIKCNYYPGEQPNEDLWERLLEAIRFNLDTYGIDGFRIDIGHVLPIPLLTRMFETIREKNPHAILISEDLFNRNHAKAAATGYNIMLGSGWNVMTDLTKDNLLSYLRELPELSIPIFACAETADTPRITSRGGVELARMLAVFNQFLPHAIPYLTTGYEVNEKQPLNCGLGDNTNGADIPRAFFNRMTISWTENHDMMRLLAELHAFKSSKPGLLRPDRFFIAESPSDVVIYGYENGEETALVCMNVSGASSVQVDLAAIRPDIEAYEIKLDSSLDSTLGNRAVSQLTLAPYQGLLLHQHNRGEMRTMQERTNNKKELILWHEFDGPGDTSIEVLEEICRLYSERNGVQVTPQVMNITELGERLGSVKELGVGPHMAFVPADMASYADIGAYSKVPDRIVADLLADDTLASMRMNGVQYGIPVLQGNHLVLFVNRDVYETAPDSWQAIEDAAERLLARDIVPIAGDLKQSYWFVPFLSAFGGWPMEEGKPSVSTPAMKQALAFVRDKQEAGILASFDGSTELLEKFIDGRIGAIICGEWIFNYLDQKMGERLVVGSLPSLYDGQSISMSSSIGLVYPNQSLESEYAEDILSFTRFMLSEECQLLWANKVQRIPTNQSVLKMLAESSSPSKRRLIALLEECRPMPIHPHMIYVWIAMELGLHLLPDYTIDQICARMESKLEEKLAAANRI